MDYLLDTNHASKLLEGNESLKPIPSIDAQIAAVARIHNLTVLTTDQHFNVVAGLSVENWL